MSIIYTTDLKTKTYYETTIEKLEKLMKKNDYTNKPLYEFIGTNIEYVKPYFDIDCKNTSKNEDEILTKSISYIKENFNIKNDEFLSISKSSSNLKFSYHITINNVKILYKDLQRFIQNNRKDLEAVFIDAKVYGSTQKFRIVNTSKINENRPLIPLNYNEEIEKHLITYTENITETFNYKHYSDKFNEYNNLIEIIDVKYVEDYNDWIKVGNAINSLDMSFKERVILFNNVSKKSRKYKDIDDIETKLKELEANPLEGFSKEYLLKISKETDSKKTKKLIKTTSIKPSINGWYSENKEKFEQTHFFLEQPTVVAEITDDKILFHSLKDMNSIMSNVWILDTEKDTPITFMSLWMMDENRKYYKKVVFEPDVRKVKFGEYNLFCGFSMDTNEDLKEDLSDINNLVNNIFSNDMEVINYFWDWTAHIIQYPNIKSEKAIILYSDNHGIGKDSLVKLLIKILDKKHTSKINSIDDLIKNFNSSLENKLLVYGDEIKARKNDLYNEMKDIITREHIIVEKKGKDTYEMSDYVNYIFTTNNYNSIKIERNDRRFVLISCNEEKPEQEIFEKFHKSIEIDSKIKTLFTILKQRVIPERMPLFESKYKKEIQNIYLNSIQKYIFTNCHYLQGKYIKNKHLYDNIKTFENVIKTTELNTINELSRKIKPFLGNITHRKSEERGYQFPDDLVDQLKILNKSAYEQYHLEIGEINSIL